MAGVRGKRVSSRQQKGRKRKRKNGKKAFRKYKCNGLSIEQ